MNASGCDMTGAAARRNLPGIMSTPTYLFSGMFLNWYSLKSGVIVGKIKTCILGGSGGVTEAVGGSYLPSLDQWMKTTC